jgi:stage III sporulation protein AD
MEVMMRVAAVAVVGSLCALLLKKQTAELALVLALCTCGVILYLVLTQMGQVLALLRRLVDLAQIDQTLVEPLLKTVAVAIITTLTAAVAKDGGQSAVAVAVELAGSFVALLLGAPLVYAVLSLLEGLL